MKQESKSTPYADLGPDVILGAVESLGFESDGRILGLNSYENRVYQVGLETGAHLVVKFYRPERWTVAQIAEEHEFVLELAAAEIPVVPPLERGGSTLHEFAGFMFSVSPRRGGRWPELQNRDELAWMGRFIARIHNVGATRPFLHRPAIDARSFGSEPAGFLLAGAWIPGHLRPAYESLSADLLDRIDDIIEGVGPIALIRLHGDCHPGNVLWTDDGPHFVDFDDCRTGPAVQDLWMLLSGTREEMTRQLGWLLEGYLEFRDFDYGELGLVEVLRTLRMIHYAGWLANRWNDPAFPRAFPWFGSARYWEEHVLSLREQLAALTEGPLTPAT